MKAGTARRAAVIARLLLLACPVAFLALALVGGTRHYSPVPFWDMWDSYLGFFGSTRDGGFGVWWAQHNEHRIVFSKVLFWLDLAVVRRGSTPFLIACNFLLAAATA